MENQSVTCACCGNRIRAFDWYRFWEPLMILNDRT